MRSIEKSEVGRYSVIAAQALVLIAFALGLMFLHNTTGASLFLFATIAPLLEMVAISILAISLWTTYREHAGWLRADGRLPGGAAIPGNERGYRPDKVGRQYRALVRPVAETKETRVAAARK
jgi:hypothetical protein